MRFGSLTPLSFVGCIPAQTDLWEAVSVAGAWSNGGISERPKTQVKSCIDRTILHRVSVVKAIEEEGMRRAVVDLY